MRYIKTFSNLFESKNYGLDHVLTIEDARKLAKFEEDDAGPIDDEFEREEKYGDFIDEIVGKTIGEFCEWRWPDEPNISINKKPSNLEGFYFKCRT